MKKILLCCMALFSLGAMAQKYEQLPLKQKLADKDLSMAVTFDSYGVNADFAKGSKLSPVMRDTNLMLRMFIGFDGRQGYLPQAGENLKLPIDKNADHNKGTVIFWYKATDYVPGSKDTKGVKRGNIGLFNIVFGENPSWGVNPPDGHSYKSNKTGERQVDMRLYEYADYIYFDYRNSLSRSCSRIQMNMKGIKQDEWCQIAASWGDGKIAMYLNGELKLEAAVNSTYKDIADMPVKSGFIGIKSIIYEDVHKYGVGIDDFKVYSRKLSHAEIKNMYARILKDKTAVAIQDYEVKLHGVDMGRGDKLDRIEAEYDFSALPENLAAQMKKSGLKIDYKLISPDGKNQSGSWIFKGNGCRMLHNISAAGKYTLESTINGKHKIVASINRPDLSFAYNGLADEDEVPALWKDYRWEERGFFGRLFCGAERTVTLWNRVYKFGAGPLPESILVKGKEIFLKAPELKIGDAKIVWSAGKTSNTNRTVTFTGTGKADNFTVDYKTTVEYDGMIKFNWTVNGKPVLDKMSLDWQLAPEYRRFLMAPSLQNPKKSKFAFNSHGSENMLWLVSEKGGFAFSTEHNANWIFDQYSPLLFADRDNGTCEVKIIQKKVQMPEAVPYEVLFITTPTRPLPVHNRILRRGNNYPIHDAGGNGGTTGVGTFLPHPTDFAVRLRNARPMSRSLYGLANALTEENEYVQYFRKYWAIPRGAVTLMPHHYPIGNGKYKVERHALLLFCNKTSFQDYIINNQQTLYKHPYGNRIGEIYYDHCGSVECRSENHNCLFKDKFGREIYPNEMLSKRKLIERTVALAHRNGRTVMCHGQRSYYPFQCGMADYWFPGEQHTVAVKRNIWCYTDEVPDEIYQSEYNRDILGIGVVILPAIGYHDDKKLAFRTPEPTESMLAMLALNDIESGSFYASSKVMIKFWDILEKYKVNSPETVCYLYNKNNGIVSSNPDVRVTYYKCPDNKYLLILSNRTKKAQNAVIDVSVIGKGNFELAEEWTGTVLNAKDGKFEITVPARNLRIAAFPPKKFYPHHDPMDKVWNGWKTSKHDTKFSQSLNGGVNSSAASQMTVGKNPGGCFLKNLPITPGKTYIFSVMAKKSVASGKISLSIQARNGAAFSGLPPVNSIIDADGKWQKITLKFTVPTKGKWGKSDGVMVTLGAGKTANCITVFDDFKVEEK